MLSRRDFLHQSALVAFSPLVPAFLPVAARAAGAQADARVLVVIQLDGGNDGINTVVPFGDDGYARNRKALRISADKLLKLNDHVGLNPAMRSAAQLVDDGRLAIVQGVGYPNPNRSHFESMRIWQTARFVADQQDRGWVGRAFDQLPWPRPGGPDAVYVGSGDLPHTLIGRRTNAIAMTSMDDLKLRGLAVSAAKPSPAGDDVASFVQRSVLDSYGAARDFARTAPDSGAASAYPDSKLAVQLKLIADLIRSGAGTRVYYASHGSFDTHEAQLEQHASLLREFSGALKAFLDDLKSAKLSQRVVAVAFSEFGRRVAENGSEGTDHGTAGPVFVAGDSVEPGLIGPAPSLEDLQNGDLKPHTDFRQVYAALLANWLALPPREPLAGTFQPLPLWAKS